MRCPHAVHGAEFEGGEYASGHWALPLSLTLPFKNIINLNQFPPESSNFTKTAIFVAGVNGSHIFYNIKMKVEDIMNLYRYPNNMYSIFKNINEHV